MLPLIGLAAYVVPEIIRLIGGDKTGTLATKVSQVTQDIVGTTDESQARAKIADPAIAAQLQGRLAEVALEAQKAQLQAEADQRQAELDQLKATLGDTQGARNMLGRLADKESPVAWGAPVVSVIIGVGFFLILGMAIFGSSYITNSNNNIVYTLVGTMATAFATMISFWLGSSQGSRNKDETVRQMQLTHAVQTADLVARAQQSSAAPVDTPPPAPVAAEPPVRPTQGANVVPLPATRPSNFIPCLHEVLHLEGAYSDDPRDPGGPTNFGITRAELADVRRVAVSSLSEADMKALTLDEAEAIYRSRYWNVMRCEDVPAGVDLMLFHFGVNAGTGASIHVLQQTVGTDVDGIIGRQTIAAACRLDARALIPMLADAQLAYYRTLNNWSTYSNGWTNRVKQAKDAALGMVTPSATVLPFAA